MGDENTGTRDNQQTADTTPHPAGMGRDEDTPNQASNKEPAEGSRQNANTGGAKQEQSD